LQAIRALANAIEARDKCTRGHTERVSKLAELVARRLGWNETQIYNLRMGCSLHDIGKIGIPDAVLNKDQELTVRERRLMEQHPEMGLKIIEGIELFRPAVPYIIGHHERYDGSGYPYGISGATIPIEGRLLAVVDAFDAIMATRPYREGSTLKAAVSELMTYKGIQFDPQIVDTFLTILAEEGVSLGEMYGRQEDTTFLIELLTEKALV
jgi:putative nucleotidyltransferase with HDIG domain